MYIIIKKKKHDCADLFILVPGDVFGGEDEPVVPATSFHDPQVVDRHVAFPDHLQKNRKMSLTDSLSGFHLVAKFSSSLLSILSSCLCAGKFDT